MKSWNELLKQAMTWKYPDEIPVSFGMLPGRKEYTRKHRLALAVIQLGLGAVWMVFSMTSFANQAVPMLLASLPFVGAAVVVWWSAQP